MWKEFRNIFAYRELIIKLAFKDLKVRYRRPKLGFLWAFLVPLSTVIVFQIVFSVILRVPVERFPFFIYLMTAVFPWWFFQVSISRATTSILDNKDLVKEVSFPRELIPISVVVAELINFIPTLSVMIVILSFFRMISFAILYLPAVVFLHFMQIIGVSLIFSSLQVRSRDIKYIVDILLTVLFYLTPVFYPLSMVAQFFNKLFFKVYLSNPLVGMLNLYRATLLKDFSGTLPAEVSLFNTLWVPLLWAIFLLIFGFYIFKRREKTFSDYLLI